MNSSDDITQDQFDPNLTKEQILNQSNLSSDFDANLMGFIGRRLSTNL
jgi:hypothetical protein